MIIMYLSYVVFLIELCFVVYPILTVITKMYFSFLKIKWDPFSVGTLSLMHAKVNWRGFLGNMEKLTEWIWSLVKLACYIFRLLTFYLCQVIAVNICMWYQFIIGRKFETSVHHWIKICISSWKFMKDFEMCSLYNVCS